MTGIIIAMTKKKFLDLIRLSAQPLPPEGEKSPRSYGYNDKQILKRITKDSKARLRGKSRPKTS